jgi:hypothetical protein
MHPGEFCGQWVGAPSKLRHSLWVTLLDGLRGEIRHNYSASPDHQKPREAPGNIGSRKSSSPPRE